MNAHNKTNYKSKKTDEIVETTNKVATEVATNNFFKTYWRLTLWGVRLWGRNILNGITSLLKALKKIGTVIFSYYSLRAVFLHLGYLYGLLPNTSNIARFVLIVSQFFLLIRPGYLRMYGITKKIIINELIVHRLRIFLIPRERTSMSRTVLLVSLWIYLLVHHHRVYIFYRHPQKIMRSILF